MGWIMMKFELPFIKVMVTADGPVCLEEKSGIYSHGSDCGCKCECPCPCPCQNTGVEEQVSSHNPHDCSMYPCKIAMPNPPIVLKHPMHESVPYISPVSASNESYLMKNDMYMLREEQFGSMLFDKNTFNTYLCNHTATEILKFIEGNKCIRLNNIEKISSYIQETFEDVPNDISLVVYSFIYGCMQLRETPLVKTD